MLFFEYLRRAIVNVFLWLVRRYKSLPPRRILAPTSPAQVGLFLVHPTGRSAVAVKNSFLARTWLARFFSPDTLNRLRFILPKSLLYMGMATLEGKDGEQVGIAVAGVPYLTTELVDPNHQRYVEGCNSIVDTARYLLDQHPEAKCLGLGAATSIARKSGVGTAEALEGVVVTSGNALTVYALARQAFDLTVWAHSGNSVRDKCLAIVGAGGSIGSRLVEYIAEYHMGRMIFDTVILVGRPSSKEKSDRRLEKLREILEAARFTVIITHERKEAHQRADLVVVVTNEAEPFLMESEWPKTGQIIIDANEPPNIPLHLESVRPDVLVVSGARVVMPCKGWPMGRIVGYHDDVVPACCGELYLHAAGLVDYTGLEKHSFVGAFTQDAIKRVERAFRQSLLSFAPPHGANRRPIPPERLQSFLVGTQCLRAAQQIFPATG